MVRVLDIDLDFFLADCCPLAPAGARPELLGHEPWDEAAVVDFLERQCGLDAKRPLPGAIVTTHDEALRLWSERRKSGVWTEPFSVTHIDAHSDLGIGRPGPGFVLNTVLAQSPAVRADLARYYAQKQLDEANYLLFALAFRWIASLDNVRNPKSRPDIPPQILLPGRTDAIRLTSFVARFLEEKNGPEPVVPFHVYDDYRTFSTPAPYDYMTVAISPRYAPREADALLPVFSRYLQG